MLNMFTIWKGADTYFLKEEKTIHAESRPQKKIPAQEMDRKKKIVQAKNVPPLPSLF